MRHFLPLLLLPLLAACATPREACEARATKDLRVMNTLIAETRANVDRGYAIEREPYVSTRYQICARTGDGPVEAVWCNRSETRYRDKQVAIDPAAEQRKLRNMIAKRDQLQREARAKVSACRQAYPEG
ncbi:hypothetical protein [Oceanicola sp. 502str15]|uniref:hypothetical protein n=1 Tax=Oceanicola sp. 502str15 TaxID=2696061 RepID=UPI00209612FA|nr:hypothetical protein [Oceanicola sp. 502str15]MCO6384444.1 hypothetical protein [Oceanicola sp. 502str15]